jgi:hypothetical protein
LSVVRICGCCRWGCCRCNVRIDDGEADRSSLFVAEVDDDVLLVWLMELEELVVFEVLIV